MSGACGGGGRAPVKIVLINTQYVETDETSFKSVVQELTGQDSRVGSKNNIVPSKSRKVGYEGSNVKVSASASINHSLLNRDLSFKEFDRLLKELPPVDELCDCSWTN